MWYVWCVCGVGQKLTSGYISHWLIFETVSLIELGVCPFSSIGWPVSSQALSVSLYRCTSHISFYMGVRDSNSSLLTCPASTNC